MLAKVDLNFDSPRMSKAMKHLGISWEECQKKEKAEFAERGLEDNVVSLRHKHYQHRLIDTYNQLLTQRRLIKEEEKKAAKVKKDSEEAQVTAAILRSESPVFE